MSISINNILKTLMNKVIDLHASKYDYNSFENLCMRKKLTSSVTSATNWTLAEGSNCYYTASQFRLYLHATRSSNWGAGDIANEKIGSYKVYHEGKISGMYNHSGYTWGTGPIVSIYTNNVAFGSDSGGDYVTFDIYLAATHSAAKAFNCCMIVPVIVNVDGF